MPDKRVQTLAKTMRRRMTKYEYRLYASFLSQIPVTVCRQKVIGDYIVDFLIPSAKLVIEVDGSQHYEEKNIALDAERDQWLSSQGYSVARYTNNDIYTNLSGVAEDIMMKIGMEV